MLNSLSRKEIIGLLLFLTALVCILNAALFGNYLPTTSSYVQLTQQSASVGTAYICILYGASTWLFHSNYSEPRQHMRYVLLAMLVVLVMGNIFALVLVVKRQFFAKVNDALRIEDIYSTFGWLCNTITIVLTVVTIALLIIVFALVCTTAMKKNRTSIAQDPNNLELLNEK